MCRQADMRLHRLPGAARRTHNVRGRKHSHDLHIIVPFFLLFHFYPFSSCSKIRSYTIYEPRSNIFILFLESLFDKHIYLVSHLLHLENVWLYNHNKWRQMNKQQYKIYRESEEWAWVVAVVTKWDEKCVKCGIARRPDRVHDVHHTSYAHVGLANHEEVDDCELLCRGCHSKKHPEKTTHMNEDWERHLRQLLA